MATERREGKDVLWKYDTQVCGAQLWGQESMNRVDAYWNETFGARTTPLPHKQDNAAAQTRQDAAGTEVVPHSGRSNIGSQFGCNMAG